MADLAPSLSSLQATLSDATDRLTELADVAEDDGREEIAAGLWEAERSLRAGLRRLETVRRNL